MKMLNSVRLSDNQKRVIAKVVAAPTPKVAAEEVSNGSNLTQARDTLIDLQLLQQSLDDHVTLRDKGSQVARDENLIDDAGQLTPDGEKYAYTDQFGGDDADQASQQDGELPPPEGLPPSQDTTSALMASYAMPSKMPLLRELLLF